MARQRSMKDFAIAYKGGKCLRCGYGAYQGALEFHHRDPLAKEFSLSRARMLRLDRLPQELDKCDLLCANCHREVHQEMGPRPEPGLEELGALERICPRCEVGKPAHAFYRRRDGKGLGIYCKPCARAQVIERQHRLKAQALAYMGASCRRCGYSRSASALEFHHRDAGAKDFHLSHARVTEFEAVKEELNKCEVLCANCHREEHARQRGIFN
jgi:predicted HNH restriction endonuclease